MGITRVKLSSSISIGEVSCAVGGACDACIAAEASACILVTAGGGGKTMVKFSSLAAKGLNGPLSLPLPGPGRGRCLTGLTRGLFVREFEAIVPLRLDEAAGSGRACVLARFEDLGCLGGLGMGLRGGVSAFNF